MNLLGHTQLPAPSGTLGMANPTHSHLSCWHIPPTDSHLFHCRAAPSLPQWLHFGCHLIQLDLPVLLALVPLLQWGSGCLSCCMKCHFSFGLLMHTQTISGRRWYFPCVLAFLHLLLMASQMWRPDIIYDNFTWPSLNRINLAVLTELNNPLVPHLTIL